MNLMQARDFTPKQIELVEKKYNARFIFETCLKMKDGSWSNFPAAVFYTDKPHPEGSNYMGLYYSNMNGSYMICNAFSAVVPFEVIRIPHTEVYLHSRYRHDNYSYDGYSIDGGRDYTRVGHASGLTKPYITKLEVFKDKIEIATNEDSIRI